MEQSVVRKNDTMKTINDQFEQYFRLCYPKGASDVQRKEVRQAWIASAVEVLRTMAIVGELPMEEAVAAMGKYSQEVLQEARKLAGPSPIAFEEPYPSQG